VKVTISFQVLTGHRNPYEFLATLGNWLAKMNLDGPINILDVRIKFNELYDPNK
jgi:hypothetical protein